MRHNQVCCRNMSHLLLPHTRLTGYYILITVISSVVYSSVYSQFKSSDVNKPWYTWWPSSICLLLLPALWTDGKGCYDTVSEAHKCSDHKSLYIKYGKVSVYTSVMVGMASSVANDVTMRMTS